MGVTGGHARPACSSSRAARKTTQIAVTQLLVSRGEAEPDPQISRKSCSLQADPGPPNLHLATNCPSSGPNWGSWSPTCRPDSGLVGSVSPPPAPHRPALVPLKTRTLASTTPREASLLKSVKIGKKEKEKRSHFTQKVRGHPAGFLQMPRQASLGSLVSSSTRLRPEAPAGLGGLGSTVSTSASSTPPRPCCPPHFSKLLSETPGPGLPGDFLGANQLREAQMGTPGPVMDGPIS